MSPGLHLPSRRKPFPLIPILLLVLAFLDLRVEFLLMLDHFTLATLAAAIRSHLLAVTVILLQPSLWRHYWGRSG